MSLFTESEYEAALRAVRGYFEQEPEPGTPEGDRFEHLITLIEAYEAIHFPLFPTDPTFPHAS